MKLTKAKTIFGIIIIGAAITVISYFTLWSSEETGQREIPYKDFPITVGTFKVEVSASGTVVPINRVEIKSKASGEIESIPVEEGDHVKRGDLIVRLDQTDVLAELEQARADLDIARAELKQAGNNYERRKKLFEKEMISEEEMDNSELAVAQAKGKMVRAKTSLDQAQERFDETIVTAPISGIILQKYVEEGQIIASGISNVSGGTTIADIADMSHVYIEAGIDEIDVGKIAVGQAALVTAEAYPDRKFQGKIIRIAPEARINQNVTLFDVVIEVENNEGLLKSGMNADVRITIVEDNNVLLAPTMALKPARGEGPNFRTAMIKENDNYRPQKVEIGRTDFDKTIILSGLKEGDTIGVPMNSRLKAENDRLERMIKSSRSFGSSSSSNSSSDSTKKRGNGD